MEAHVTCGRGTEVFVKEELLTKLKCRVMTVEDGKVFFAVDVFPVTWHHQTLRKILNLKTVERVFATITHFPTCEIKGHGKVKFLQALKARILEESRLRKVVTRTLETQKVLTLTPQSDSHCCNKETVTLTPQSDSHCCNKETVPLTPQSESHCCNKETVTLSPQSESHCCKKETVTLTPQSTGCDLMTPINQTTGVTCGCCTEAVSHHEGSVNCPDQSLTCSEATTQGQAKQRTCHGSVDHQLLGQGLASCLVDADNLNEAQERGAVNRSTAMRCHAVRNGQPQATQADPWKCSDDSRSAAKRHHDCRESPGTRTVPHGALQSVADDRLHVIPQKKQKLSEESVSDGCGADAGLADVQGERPEGLTSDGQEGESDSSRLTFRFSVKCGGWCKKWLQPQRLSRELGIKLTINTGWGVDLKSPRVEICVHVNDDFVTVGIPLIRTPLSKRSYILDAGLRSTVSWVMASLADIQPGYRVLDPMCGKATILLEAAQFCSQTPELIGCDLDPVQLHAAGRNVAFADLGHRVQLIQADAVNLPLSSASVDRIVCDAPFGHKFRTASCSLPHLYAALLQEMYRLLVPGGLSVMLTCQDLLPVILQHVDSSPPSTGTACVWEHRQTGTHSPVNKDTSDVTDSGDPKTRHDTLVNSQTAITASKTQRDTQTVSLIIHASGTTASTPNAEAQQRTELPPSCDPLGAVTAGLDDVGMRLTPSPRRGTGFTCETTNAGRFRHLTSHYVKLGETHAYIVLLRKPELPPLSATQDNGEAVG